MNKRKSSFRLRSKKIFLTYPRCNLRLELVFSQLKLILSNYIIENYLLVTEDHQDNSINIDKHVHVYLEFSKGIDIKDANVLDLIDGNGLVFHGNYQRCKNKTHTIIYLLKDVLNLNEIIISPGIECRVNSKGVIMGFEETLINLAEAGRIKEAMAFLRKEDPKTFLKSGSHYEKRLKEVYLNSKGAIRKFDFSKFILPEGLLLELQSALDNQKTVYLAGAAGTGKSMFVKSYLIQEKGLVPLIVNNIDSLREFDAAIHTCIVLDDCQFDSLSRETLITLFDIEHEVTLQLRYNNIRVPAGTPRFIIHNKFLYDILSLDLSSDLAIKRRIHEIKITNTLFAKAVEETELR